MKKIVQIAFFIFFLNTTLWAQDDQGGTRIRERMNEYIQKRLSLSANEAERFTPVFMDYFNELRKTNQEYRSDHLELRKKVAELQLSYRDKFKPIIGEKRSNDVFIYERDFIEEVRKLRIERSQNSNENRMNRRGRNP